MIDVSSNLRAATEVGRDWSTDRALQIARSPPCECRLVVYVAARPARRCRL